MSNGVELITGLTNLFILIISFVGFLSFRRIKKYIFVRYWTLFFMFMMGASFFGFVVHTFVLSEIVNKILWYVITLLFSIVINILLTIILLEINERTSYKQTLKETGIMTLILCLCMFILLSANLDFIFVFAIYCSLVLSISLYIYIKDLIVNKNKYSFYYIFGILIQIIGGLFLLDHDIDFKYLIDINYNVLYHIFTGISLIPFIIGTKLKRKLYK